MRQSLQRRRGPEATRLLGKPLAQPLLYVVLRECPLLFGVFQAVAHFIEDVEMVLDVLKRAVFGEFVEEGFDLLFGGGHYQNRIAWRPAEPRSRKGGNPSTALRAGRRFRFGSGWRSFAGADVVPAPFGKLRAGSSQRTRRNGAPTVLVVSARSKAGPPARLNRNRKTFAASYPPSQRTRGWGTLRGNGARKNHEGGPPALRKEREGRGTPCVAVASEIKSLGHPPTSIPVLLPLHLPLRPCGTDSGLPLGKQTGH